MDSMPFSCGIGLGGTQILEGVIVYLDGVHVSLDRVPYLAGFGQGGMV